MAETISRSEFDSRLGAGELALTLVGMSNIGKSYWSKRLAGEKGFDTIGCDDLIEAELGVVLRESGFEGGVADMAKWMGQPYEPQSTDNQRRYLELETGVMERTIRRLAKPSLNGSVVIDTTGSVVHTSSDVRSLLAGLSIVAYLQATPDMQQEMFNKYLVEPKPVVWGEIYEQEPGESQSEALARRYPELLAYRTSLYEQMADVVIARDDALALPGADDFLMHIRNMLPA